MYRIQPEPLKSESEWETDSEPPTDTEAEKDEPAVKPADENKENVGVKENGETERKESEEGGAKEAKVPSANIFRSVCIIHCC